MRLSTDYYPEYVSFTCESCWWENGKTKVDSIEDDHVRVLCESCDAPTYVRVIED